MKDKKYHILIIPSWYPQSSSDVGGSFFREQAKALSENGHTVGIISAKLVSIKKALSHFDKLSISFENDAGMKTYRKKVFSLLPKIPYGTSSVWIHAGMKLFREYIDRNGKPDIIHAHSLLYGGILASKIKKHYGVPFVTTEHRTSFSLGKNKWWEKELAKRACENADKLIAVSEPFAKLLNNEFPRTNWIYIPNMLSDIFEKKIPNLSRRVETKCIFCNVSLLSQKKGIDVLIKAFSAAFSGNPNVELLIGGTGPDLEKLKKLSVDNNVSDQTQFLGMLKREEVRELFEKSHVYALSSYSETFGVVLIEALSQSVPVVATKCGGPESIVTEENGILVEKGNVDKLKDALLTIKKRYDQYNPEKLRADCIARFGQKEVCRQITSVYTEVLSSERGSLE